MATEKNTTKCTGGTTSTCVNSWWRPRARKKWSTASLSVASLVGMGDMLGPVRPTPTACFPPLTSEKHPPIFLSKTTLGFLLSLEFHLLWLFYLCNRRQRQFIRMHKWYLHVYIYLLFCLVLENVQGEFWRKKRETCRNQDHENLFFLFRKAEKFSFASSNNNL